MVDGSSASAYELIGLADDYYCLGRSSFRSSLRVPEESGATVCLIDIVIRIIVY